MSELVVGSLKGLSANSFVIDVASGSTLDLSAGAVFPAGNVLQVVSTTKTDTFSVTSTSYTDVTGLSLSITPKFTTSKIFVVASIQASSDVNVGYGSVQLVRDSTAISVGATAGSRRVGSAHIQPAGATDVQSLAVSHLDSPNTTSATTYKIQITADRASTAVYLNRSHNDTDNLTGFRGASTITAYEIAG